MWRVLRRHVVPHPVEHTHEVRIDIWREKISSEQLAQNIADQLNATTAPHGRLRRPELVQPGESPWFDADKFSVEEYS